MKDLKSALRAEANGGPAEPELSGAKARLMARAERDGLVDVAYALVTAPFGDILVAATARGLVRVSFAGEPPDAVLR